MPLLPPFSPDPAQTAAIIDATTDPDLSFRAIAEIHNISVETLALFLDRPDIKERLAKIDSSISSRTQSLANASLPSVVKALTRAVEVYLWEENRIVVRPTDFAQLEQRRRATETMRRAGWLLSRLTRPPTPPRPPRDPDGPSRAPRAPEPPSAPKKTQGFPSLGPAPDATRAPTPTPDHIDETSAPLAPQSPSRKPSLADDAAILRQLAAGRQAAGRVLHAITGIVPPPEDPDEELDQELEEELEDDADQVECDPDEVDTDSDEFLERLAQNLGKPLSHPMVPRATRTLFSLFPIFRGENRVSINDVPSDIFGPARAFLLDAHTRNLPIKILPDNPLGALARYLATTHPTRAGPAP